MLRTGFVLSIFMLRGLRELDTSVAKRVQIFRHFEVGAEVVTAAWTVRIFGILLTRTPGSGRGPATHWTARSCGTFRV